MNPLRRVWDWILWWPLRDLMPRPACQTMEAYWRDREKSFGQFDRCGHSDEEIAAHPDWTCPETMDYHKRVEVKHPYRHPDPHSHAGIDSCFVCEEHTEATGCVIQHHRELSKEDLAVLQDPDTWDFGER